MKAKHGTLVASTVATVNLVHDADAWTESVPVEIASDGAAPIYFTTDGTTPAVSGDDTFVVRGGSLRVDVTTTGTITMKLVSAGTPTYSVTMADGRGYVRSSGLGGIDGGGAA